MAVRIIGIGVDLEQIGRFDPTDQRLFKEGELRYCLSRDKPSESFAGRWCAKEAVVKALASVVRVSPRDVTIEADASGRPIARVDARVPRGVHIEVSIAHDRTTAIANAVAFRRSVWLPPTARSRASFATSRVRSRLRSWRTGRRRP